ncbi:MAG: family 2 glycosyl transferase [Bacteroidetes bacterium OLB9]|nr:MAG: family 2 glycosyl transferase [Bacteroidetes bacterium OLB9]
MSKISIIIPVYNVEDYLDKCVKSVVNQTYTNLEIILVNDGSKDNSSKLCDEWALRDNRISVIHQSNQGLSGARNSGIKAAKGIYITFLDSDDWLEKDALEISLKKAKEGDYDLIFWQMIKEYENLQVYVQGPFGKDTNFLGSDMKALHRRLTGPIGKELKTPQQIDSFASAWGKLYKKNIIDANNLEFIDTKIIGSEDILFNFYYFNYCHSAFYIHKHLIHYKKDNLTSLTKTHGSTLFPRFINLFMYIQDGINRLSLGPDFELALQNRIAISMMNIGLSETSPRNSKSVRDIIQSLKEYLNHPTYIKAYMHFQYPIQPFQWWLFFYACKKRWAICVYGLLKGMRLFIK